MEQDVKPDLLEALLDLLIPATPDGRIPAAGALGVAKFIRENTPNPDSLAQLLARAEVLHQAGLAMDAGLIERLEAEAPEAFAPLLRLTYMGYYSRPETRVLFGLSALPVHPRGYDVAIEPPDLLEALVAPVRARGGVFRAC